MVLIETQKQEFQRLKDIRIFEKIGKEQPFNRDLLFIGLGGLGRLVLESLKGMLKDRLDPEDNIGFLLIDSCIPEMEESIRNSRKGNGLKQEEILSIYRPNLEHILENGIGGRPVQETIAKWMNRDFPKLTISQNGAEGNRQIGRLMFSNAYEDTRVLLFEKIDEYYKSSESGKLDVILVSGVSGGTGSGILSDVAYNIKAFARSRKWKNFRIGGCLLMPDVLFGTLKIREDEKLRTRLLANGCAAMDEISRLMQARYNGESYTFESGSHRLVMTDNIFDACMLVSGKEDDQGYVPTNVICSDTAFFLTKLAQNKYIGNEGAEGTQGRLLRDVFFEKSSLGQFKVVNEADYRIPIREIENICESEIFQEVSRRLHALPEKDAEIDSDIENSFRELRDFLAGVPGDEINLDVNGLIRTASFTKPPYKLIKKHKDDLSTVLAQQLENMEKDLPVIVKAVRIRLQTSLNQSIEKYLKTYGPFVTMQIIGASGTGGVKEDTGMIAEVQKLEKTLNAYVPSNEYEMVVKSILKIVAHRWFTFPSAKRETEQGYFENALKSALAKERNLLMEELNKQDVFGDVIRQLRRRAEQISDIYEPFFDDLSEAVEGLAKEGRRLTGFLLKDAARQEFLPSDYLSGDRVSDFQRGMIDLMVNHETDIETEKIVPVSEAMQRLYKNFLTGLGVHAPEKLIASAFSDEPLTLSNVNVMFVSPDSRKRKDIMNRAASAFVTASREKTEKKQLCLLQENAESGTLHQKYISLPADMPWFSQAVSDLLTSPPYEESPESITRNPGEMMITTDSFYLGVKPSMLACWQQMRQGYDKAAESSYTGLHIF